MSKSGRKSMNQSVIVTVTPRNQLRSVGGSSFTSSRSNVRSSGAFLPSGATAQASKDTVQSFVQGRSQEKKEISQLNMKFADYIQSVKYLETQVKALLDENDKLRKMKGYCGDRIKEQYEDELRDAREALDTVKKQLSPLQAAEVTLKDKIESLEEELDRLRRQLDEKTSQVNKVNQMLSDMEGEVTTLRHQCEVFGKDNDYLKKELQAKRDDNDRLRADFESAVRKQIDAECERDAIAEELEFVVQTSTMEIEELRELLKNLKSCMPVVKEDFQASFKSAVQAMQKDYDERLQIMSDEMQRRYDDQLASIQANIKRDAPDQTISKSENKTLKSSLDANRRTIAELERVNAGLRSELEALKARLDEECEECEEEKNRLRDQIEQLNIDNAEIMKDLQAMRATNLDMSVEINTYRKLLEGEENSMKKIVEQSQSIQTVGGSNLASIIGGGGSSSGGGMSQQSMSESGGRIRMQKKSTVSAGFTNVALDGSLVTLENSGSRDFDLSNWSIERSHDKGTSRFTFPAGFKVQGRKSVRVFSFTFEDMVEDANLDLVGTRSQCRTWGLGDGKLVLLDDKGDEKATCTISTK